MGRTIAKTGWWEPEGEDLVLVALAFIVGYMFVFFVLRPYLT